SLIIDFNKADVCRDIGRIIHTNAIVYDWCYDLIEEPTKKLLILQMESLATKLEVIWPKLVQGSIVGHGVEAQLSRDMLACGIATYDEKPAIYKLVAGRIMAEFVPARNFFYPAGYHHQGSAYGPGRFKSDLQFTLLFDRMGYPNIVNNSQGSVPYKWFYTRRPDGQLFRDGDDYNELFIRFGKYWPLSSDALTASYYKDPVLMSETIKANLIGQDPLYDFLLIDPTVPAVANTSQIPLTRYFKAPLGAMVARTGWGDSINSNTVVAEMKIGVYNFVNHQHLDAGSFQIYYKGPLAINSGIYQGTNGAYGGEHFINYYQRTIAHNSMLVYDPAEKFTWHGRPIVNDGGQQFPNGAEEPLNMDALLGNGYKTGEVLAHEAGPDSIQPDFSYMKGELAEAYGNKVKSFRRSFVFLNLHNARVPAALIIFDRVQAFDKNFKKTWLLHSVEEPIIRDNSTTINRHEKGYNGSLVNTTLLPLPGNLLLKKVGGKDSAFTVNGINYPQQIVAADNSGDGAVWRLEESPKESAYADNFLNVMQVMDYGNGNDRSLSVGKEETENLVGATIGDRIIFFSKTSEISDKRIDLKVKGDGPKKILITDVANGDWLVTRTGDQKNSPGIITSHNNLLYFNAIKGNYRIIKK
ncbi:MAG: heparin/heparin-sulfate lyase HepB, partial [Ferruginibacter sp.]